MVKLTGKVCFKKYIYSQNKVHNYFLMDFKQDTNLVATNWMPTVLGLTEGLFAMSVQACFKSQLPLTIGTVAVNKLKEKHI